MKVKAFSISIAVAAFMIWGMSVSPLGASQYLGEVTWDYSGGGTIKAGISKAGGSYYEVQGQAALPDGTVIFAGGGALVGGTLMLSAVSTQVETNSGGTYHNATTLQISVDPTTYNGSIWMVTNWYNPAFSPPFGHSYDTGTLTKTSGPTNAAAIPGLPLLLQ
ncbi:MAG: hypothetical protein PHU44_11510 [Syntrophales bacterium]|nr:hypothetical protein [Syntrophales bacterium]MDD5642276.1 hypothetical protein [Syntrophales bacterium]